MPSWWLRQEEREVGLYMEADILDVLSGFHRNSAEGFCACVGALTDLAAINPPQQLWRS